MKVKVRHKTWDLSFSPRVKENGLCDSPTVKGKRILVSSTLKGEKQLETIIHELLHAGLWSLDEECVDDMGLDIARVLWRLGYRRDDAESEI